MRIIVGVSGRGVWFGRDDKRLRIRVELKLAVFIFNRVYRKRVIVRYVVVVVFNL